MRTPASRRVARGRMCVAATTTAFLLAGCGDALRVTDPVNLTPDDLAAGGASTIAVNGARGAFQGSYDYYALYTDLLTDEFVASGTFPYQSEIDDRTIRLNNEGLLGDLYTPLATARFMADTANVILQTAGPSTGAAETTRKAGLALTRYYGGYTRVLLAEGFCESAIAVGPKLSSDDRMRDALAVFKESETMAADASDTTLVAASRLGQARASLWLADYPAAAAAATAAMTTRPALRFVANYAVTAVGQMNRIPRMTYAIQEARRWTVGNGTLKSQAFEKWPYFDEWVALGLMEVRPDLTSFNAEVPVVLQKKMPTADAPIVMASTSEAVLIRAEVALRGGDRPGAAALVNGLRATNWRLPAMAFTGDLKTDLGLMARERARELWLTGERIATLRRYLKDGLDLFPAGKAGKATCFPVPQQEIDTNPNF